MIIGDKVVCVDDTWDLMIAQYYHRPKGDPVRGKVYVVSGIVGCDPPEVGISILGLPCIFRFGPFGGREVGFRQSRFRLLSEIRSVASSSAKRGESP